MQSASAYSIFVRMNGIKTSLATLFLASLAYGPVLADRLPDLDGVWFTCEFTQSKTPPTDGCDMFDDEGFEARNGQITYMRMLGSDEVSCKGRKKGQCFPASLPQITVSTKPIGEAWLKDSRLHVTWYGCTQDYTLTQDTGFVSVKPDGKDCFWSRERHFYVAPYTGQVIRK